jgi:tetratricopeptide (TPR) repeat protein
MGFGKKTDYATGRTLDLDRTYKNIIQKAVINCDYECVRADEIQDSGIIDKSMYALLIQADLVIADISTFNPNVLYELGVRHAVRPFSTIVLKEADGIIPFDLSHTRIFTYKHLGEDIGSDEAQRCINDLSSLINSVSKSEYIDSPFYEYIKSITPPKLPKNEYDELINDLAKKEKHIFALREKALRNMAEEKFMDAYLNWQKAHEKVPNENYFIQQMALCKYKSKHPSEKTALTDALSIINELNPDTSNDPETLGLTASINKRLWLLENDIEFLNRAISYYGKGFKISTNYYTGENYALCLNLKAQEIEGDEKIYSNFEAKKTRATVINILEKEITYDNFDSRIDKQWIYATLSQCYYALKEHNNANKYEALFKDEMPQSWEVKTFDEVREQLSSLLN